MFSHWCLSGTIFLLLRHNLSLNYSPSTYFTFQTFIILSLPNHLFAIDRHTNLFFSQANSAWDSSFAVKKRRACSRSSQLQLWDNSAILRPKKILHLIAYACNRGETWLRNIRCWVRPQIVCMHAVRQRLCRIPTFSMKGTESRGQAFLFKRETTTPACSFRIVSRLNPTSTMPLSRNGHDNKTWLIKITDQQHFWLHFTMNNKRAATYTPTRPKDQT